MEAFSMAFGHRLPHNMSLLRLQNKHVTKFIWKGNDRLLRPRWHAIWVITHLQFVDPRIIHMINVVGFGQLLTIPSIDINHHLIIALVETWRIESHTFHFPHGESTITLQDVTLQLSLSIDGKPIIGFTSEDMVQACQYLLGFIPPPKCN